MTRSRGAGPWWHYLGVTVVCVLGGCGLLADEPPSVVAQSEPEVVMSGGYVVGEDGKLEKPERLPVAEPTFPEDAQTLNEEGAGEFAEFYVQILEHAWDSGTAERVLEYSNEGCSFCESTAAAIEEIETLGGWTAGLRYVVQRREPTLIFDPPTVPQRTYVVVMAIQGSAHIEYDGKRTQWIDSVFENVELHAVITEQGWRVDNVYAVERS